MILDWNVLMYNLTMSLSKRCFYNRGSTTTRDTAHESRNDWERGNRDDFGSGRVDLNRDLVFIKNGL